MLDMLQANNMTFYIPPYQRNYEWTNEQCSVFLEDVIHTAERGVKEGKSGHFFGSIVYTVANSIFGQPQTLVLTDGQQRITTTMLFLAAARDVIRNQTYKDFIDSTYLHNDRVRGDSSNKIKLKQVESDWPIYCAIINKQDKAGYLPAGANSPVYKNYAFFVSKLNDIYEKNNNDQSIIDLVQFGLARFSIVQIQLDPIARPWENPQEVFESMNSLGKPLSLADLVRNYLMLGKTPDEQEDLYRNYWLTIEKTLSGKISDYIRDYMQTITGTQYNKATEANYKELYADFKRLFSGQQSSAILHQLCLYAPYYSYIVNGSPVQGDDKNNSIRQNLTDIRALDATVTYSLLLGLIISWQNGEMSIGSLRQTLRAIKTYILRRRICKITQGENKRLPTFAKKISEIASSDSPFNYTLNLLANQDYSLRLPNDTEVYGSLTTMNFYNFRQGKYILLKMEQSLSYLVLTNEAKSFQLEHIMPQTLSSDWRNKLGPNYEEIHQKYVNNIGNLTLLVGRVNLEALNLPFGVKRELYNDRSGLKITQKDIINQSEWNEQTIQHRADELAKIIINDIVPLPMELRTANNYVNVKRTVKHKRFSFEAIDLVGEKINFIGDDNIVAEVVSNTEVTYENKRWKLAPLTREIAIRKGIVNESGSYQGANYWEYKGEKLRDLMWGN